MFKMYFLLIQVSSMVKFLLFLQNKKYFSFMQVFGLFFWVFKGKM